MLNFHKNAAVRNYFSRREQRRLWIWVLAIGVPLVLVSHFFEQWFAKAGPTSARTEPIDTRLAAVPTTGVPGSFLSPPEPEENPADEEGFFEGVNPTLLKEIRDDTPSRGAEHGPFFNLMEVLARTPDDQLRAASLGETAYVQLFRQPEVYRGKLVTLAGTVARAYQVPMTQNEMGRDHFYQLWLLPKGAPTHPIVVYSLDLPEKFKLGEKLNEKVSLTGFFFKRWAYESKGGTMTAPMVLAKNVKWKRPAEGAGRIDGAKSVGWLTFAVGLSVLGLLIVSVFASRFAARSAIVRPTADRDAIEALKNEPTVEISEELRRLAREGE